jgi:dTDP-4-amino-4,6-dideoxygalactose transaminase
VPRELTVTPAAFSAALTPKTRAAIVVHYFGRVQPHIEELAAICQEHGVTLIEDCALALGARQGERLAGTFGDTAVFSFTKSDWCYGGGAAVFRSAKWAEWARNLRLRRSRAGRRLAFFYGLLRRADWECNRPARARVAEAAGRSVEALARKLVPAFRVANFFDAGALDTRMTTFAARRALRVLRGIPAALQAQKAVHHRIVEALRGGSSGLAPIAAQPGDTGAFLLLWLEKGSAVELRERAARAGLTLRLSWPAYEPPGTHAGGAVQILGERLLILEVHPHHTLRDTTAMRNAIAVL